MPTQPPVDIVDRHPLVIEVAEDECDACPSIAHVRAYVYIELPSGRTLAYCAHHGTKHWDALHAHAANIIDLRYMVGT